ncbi:MAG: glycosyltransferase, partial [Planctomycetota bacterium]|nr:glycosyltransferase [Planctomycetota bacterium]
MTEKAYDPGTAMLDPRLKSFYSEAAGGSRTEIRERLRNLCESERELAPALLWLHEYQLHAGRDAWSREYEKRVNPSFMARKSGFWSYALPGHDDRRSQMNWGGIESTEGPSLFPLRNESRGFPSLAFFRDVFRGQRAFILGGGPSLFKLDLSPLGKEITFGMGGVLAQFGSLGFSPSFYASGDPYTAPQYAGAVGKNAASVKFFGHFLKPCQGIDHTGAFVNLIYDLGEYPGYPHFSVDAAARTWAGESPAYQCLQWAYYMGFKEVYLIGFDHSFPGDPDLCMETDGPPGGKAGKRGARLREEFVEIPPFARKRFLLDSDRCFAKARHAFALAGGVVRNATPGGRLRVLERCDYTGIFRDGRPAEVGGELGVDWLAKRLAGARDSAKRVFAGMRRAGPDISIIVPMYQVEGFVHRCLASIRDQTFGNFEVIVVNDGSTDGGPGIVENMAETDSRIRVIRQENRGLGPARNAGLKAALAPYALFVDSDDFIHPDLCRLLLGKAREERLDIVNCQSYRTRRHGKNQLLRPNFGMLRDPAEAARAMLRGELAHMAWGRLYRTALLRDNGLEYPPGYYEDKPVTVAAYLLSGRVGSIDG